MSLLEFIPILAAVLILVRWGAESWLALLNRRHVRSHSGEVPAAFRGTVDDATYAKSVEYTLARSCFGQAEEGWGTLVLLAVLFSGLLPLSLGWVREAWASSAWADAGWLFAVGVALSLPGLPFDWWGQFRLEERFGFNTTTLGTWLLDRVKGLLLGAALGYPLLVLILKLVGWMGDRWWVWAWLVLLGFQLVMMVLAPVVILPLFNKLTPLPDGALRERLLKLGERTGFSAKTILVMDGSKRSRHSNAFFTGFGGFRKIVLFDTLISQLSEPELEAVLAHEVGHYKKGHIPKMLAWAALSSLIAFAVIAWLAKQAWFTAAFGFRADQGLAHGDVLDLAGDELLVPEARIRGRRLRRAGDGRNRLAEGRPAEADGEKPVQPDPAPVVQRVALLASHLAGTGNRVGAGRIAVGGKGEVVAKQCFQFPQRKWPSTSALGRDCIR